jgi:hypothetical protein
MKGTPKKRAEGTVLIFCSECVLHISKSSRQNMKAICSSEMLVTTGTYKSTERHNPEDHTWTLTTVEKSKAVPLHAMEAHEGRGGIAPTHS